MGRPVEVEWQFVVGDVDGCERWLRVVVFDDRWSVVPVETVHIRDAYFDTSEWLVARSGYALRVRRSGDRVEATLKALARSRRGVARRREITERVPNARVASLRVARGVVAGQVRATIGTEPLRRLFALRTRRRVFAVRLRGRTLAELALDRTRIMTAGGRVRRIERLEVEVTRGTPAEVARFVATLRRARHLTVAERSKFAEGLSAARLRPPRAR